MTATQVRSAFQERRSDAVQHAVSTIGVRTTKEDPDGHALLPPPAPSFWSEHSDRAGLDGWCATLGVQETERSFLGRWAAKSSTDGYVRTACRVVENLQRLACGYARLSLSGGPDFFEKEHTLCALEKHLLAKVVSADHVALTLKGLTRADAF